MIRSSCLAALVGLLFGVSPALADEPAPPTTQITFDQAMRLARTQGHDLALADAHVSEAEERARAARVRPNNPTVTAWVGPRFGPGGDVDVDAMVRAQQWIDTGGRREARIEEAAAHVDVTRSRRDDAERLIVQDVGRTFAELLYWQRRVELADERVALSEQLESVARRRHELGDTGGLAVSSAAIETERAHMEATRTRTALERAEGRMVELLGFEAGTELEAIGDLRSLAEATRGPGTADGRGDVRALEAEVRAAKAARVRGRAARVPRISVGVGYAHEESSHVALGSLGFAIPVFDRGQGSVSVAEARGSRALEELEVVRLHADIEAETADSVVQQASQAARRFEARALAEIERTESVLTRSYELGAAEFDEVLVVRLQLQQAQIEHADLLLEAAVARMDLAAARGEAQ